MLRKALAVNISAPGWSKSLTGTDFGTPVAPTYTQTFETPKSGELNVSFALKDSLGNRVNSGSISLDIRRDWVWGVDLVL
ncbi:MAG TPA: hypothetical protein VI758_05715, partial [Bacteroidota bacterium]